LRQLRLNLGYLHSAPLLLRDKPGAKAKLRATIRALERAATLPGPNDKMTVLHDLARGVATLVYVRRVRGCNLWLWYNAIDEMLALHALTDSPP
jgi:hypothetical protein